MVSTAEPDAVASGHSIAHVDRRAFRRTLAASAFGTVVEWYDFFLYGTAAALIFGPLFFPSDDRFISTIAGLSVYAVGYVARPLGGMIFGHFGDRLGRRSMLVTSMLLMGAGTFLVGLLPTYAQIGIWAPVLLVLLRLVQAVGLGGEWGGAVLLVVESSPPSRRGLFGSFVQLGNPVGRLLATGVFALSARLPETEFLAWGWRMPFLASALLIGTGLFIRFRIDETPEFKNLASSRKTVRAPLIEIVSRYHRQVLIAVGLKLTEVAWVGLLTVFAVTYLTGTLKLNRSLVLDAITLATLCEIIVMPMSGWLSDIIGRRPIYIAGTLAGICLAFPMFWLFETRDPLIVTATIVVGICLCQGIVFALHASFLPELFDAKVRYSGISLGFQLGAAIGGGLTPVVAAAVMGWSGGTTWPISSIMVLLGVLTIWAVMKTKNLSPVEKMSVDRDAHKYTASRSAGSSNSATRLRST